MKLGIVGLPNVGKSTLFNALTRAGAESANYPFCTIEPNVGIVKVPDARLDKLADALTEGQEVEAKIIDVDAENKRISLSIRALLTASEEEEVEE